MEDDVLAENGRLNFCICTDFDVDAVFGTHVCTTENEDYLNVYANFDMAAHQVCGELEVVLWHGDDTCESLSYQLDAAEQQYIRERMDAYCQKREGMTLEAFCDYLAREETSLDHITTDDLRRMGDQDGLILQGCGGDLQEWVDGINGLLTEAGILLDGSKFEAVSAFRHDGATNLLFHFDDAVRLDMGKLAMWRLQTHEQFGGTWLSDYVPNRLGGFEKEQAPPQKPKMELLGRDGNIFALMGDASQLLQRAGMVEQDKEMIERVTSCGDYYKALNIISEYVDTELSDHSQPQNTNFYCFVYCH